MQETKRINSMCAVCHKIFEIGDNDKVFVEVGDKTVTVCVPCQNKIRNKEVCNICNKPRNKQNVKSIRLVKTENFMRVCIWCIKRLRKVYGEQ